MKEKLYYVYVPGISQLMIRLYPQEIAESLAATLRLGGGEAWVCEFGYPFA